MVLAISFAAASSEPSRYTLKAMRGMRAPTAVAPAGPIACGPKSGKRSPRRDRVAQPLVLAAPDLGQRRPLGHERRPVVEVHGQVERVRELLAERPGELDARRPSSRRGPA